jgi:hypothetical protein
MPGCLMLYGKYRGINELRSKSQFVVCALWAPMNKDKFRKCLAVEEATGKASVDSARWINVQLKSPQSAYDLTKGLGFADCPSLGSSCYGRTLFCCSAQLTN